MRRLLLWGFAACGVEQEVPAPTGTCDGGQVQVALVSALRFARPVDGVSAGFDLDGHDSGAGDAVGCGRPDFAGGVDNALAGLLPALELTEAGAAEPLIEAAIREGGLQIITQWSGIDGPDDECLTLQVLSGTGPVFVGTDESVLPSQTLVVDPTVPASTADAATAAGGVITAGPIALEIPFRVLDADIRLVVEDAQLQLTPREGGGWTGVVGGGVDTARVVATLEPLGIDRGVIALLASLLEAQADLSPGADGVCTRLSAALEIEAVPAFLFGAVDGG